MEPAIIDKEIEKYQQKIIELNRLAELGQLSAGILHEIKNPVSFVNNFSRLANELVEEIREIAAKPLSELSEADVEGEKEILNTLSQNLMKISENGKRIERIIQGMLAQARSDSAVFEPTDLNQLLEEYSKLAYYSVRAEDREFNLTFNYELDPEVGQVNLSRGEFGRVVVNLVNNGCYAINEKRKTAPADFEPIIEITTKRLADTIQITICDNGIGIPEDSVAKLFQPFFTTKPIGKGTGLGLSLTYTSVVDTHKGKISVTSIPGERTEFKILIPA
ncbi:Signal transduction histidine-protein kinase AtoS [Dyadobacter sp. CECT 9623]|uniref:histidine kinase n=1 Tax=Dyadobacter linearis TaxID=2823330 RepID=A0ABN7R9Y9_9BACT|nr:ATP-binding protein [Dyadobacter sp. CECT 9623]CAG5069287.1 Signal transduction histidine-protein kinase AtoS [Dyadobacter sp. CECT 9623]